MTLSAEQLSLKEQGNQSILNGDSARAIALFTQAIDLPDGTSSDRAVLFSNRSAAYMLAMDHESALEDAESCIRLHSDFAKGWGRKAAALKALGRIDEAVECYRAALSKPEANIELYNGEIAKCLTEKSQSRRSSETGSNPSTGSRWAESVTYPPGVLAMRIVSLFMAIYWIVSGDGSVFTQSMLVMAASSIANVLMDIGRPRFSAEYGERFLTHPTKPMFLLPLVYSTFNPVLPAVFATQFAAIGPLFRQVDGLLARFPLTSGAAARAEAIARESRILASITGLPHWSSLSAGERASRFDETADKFCSRFELAVMLILTLQTLFTSAGSFLSIIIYAQVLKFRYISNPPTKSTIHELDAKLSTLARRFPATDKAYQMVRNGVRWFGMQGIEQAQTRRAAGAQPNCVVM